MEEAKQAFLNRYNEIKSLHDGIFSRQNKIREELNGLGRELAKFKKEDIDVDSISENLKQKLDLKSKRSKLHDELNALYETGDKIYRLGGLQNLLMSDEALKAAGEKLHKALIIEAKKDANVRENLEKRFEKAINELQKLEEDRQVFIENTKEKKHLLSQAYQFTGGTFDILAIKKSYTFEQQDAYVHLGKLKNYLRG
jgi:hypothetical protein